MAEQTSPNTPQSSDEIDLGKLFKLMRKGFDRFFRVFLRIFLYLKRKAFLLIGLVLIGLVIGFFLNISVDKKLKTEVIVKPNFESKDYLYDVIGEIQANIVAKDAEFLNKIGIDIDDLRGFEVSIEPIEKANEDQKQTEDDNTYLEILQNFKDQEFVSEVIRSEILDKTVLTHRITFLHKNPFNGQQVVGKILDYINANPYFVEMRTVYENNAGDRIAKNKELIEQIDNLIENYTQQLMKSDADARQESTIVFDTEKGLDVTSLLSLKNGLIKQIGDKQIELVQQKDAVNIINLGKTQEVKNQFLNKSLFLLPLVFLGLFFLWALLKYLNKKALSL